MDSTFVHSCLLTFVSIIMIMHVCMSVCMQVCVYVCIFTTKLITRQELPKMHFYSYEVDIHSVTINPTTPKKHDSHV